MAAVEKEESGICVTKTISGESTLTTARAQPTAQGVSPPSTFVYIRATSPCGFGFLVGEATAASVAGARARIGLIS